MALALSTGASTAVGVDAAGFQISNEYAMHALNRDVNGLLIYTKTKLGCYHIHIHILVK